MHKEHHTSPSLPSDGPVSCPPGQAAAALMSEAHGLLYPADDIYLDEWQARGERIHRLATFLWQAGEAAEPQAEAERLLALLMAKAAIPLFGPYDSRRLATLSRQCIRRMPVTLLTVRLRLYLYGDTYEECLYEEAHRWLQERIQTAGTLTVEEQKLYDTLELLREEAEEDILSE